MATCFYQRERNEIATAPSKRSTQVSHVVSIVVLALRLNATKSAVGISLKTQELYLIVFVARYADLFSHFYSYYNTLMKIAFITSTAAIIYTVRFRAPSILQPPADSGCADQSCWTERRRVGDDTSWPVS